MGIQKLERIFSVSLFGIEELNRILNKIDSQKCNVSHWVSVLMTKFYPHAAFRVISPTEKDLVLYEKAIAQEINGAKVFDTKVGIACSEQMILYCVPPFTSPMPPVIYYLRLMAVEVGAMRSFVNTIKSWSSGSCLSWINRWKESVEGDFYCDYKTPWEGQKVAGEVVHKDKRLIMQCYDMKDGNTIDFFLCPCCFSIRMETYNQLKTKER